MFFVVHLLLACTGGPDKDPVGPEGADGGAETGDPAGDDTAPPGDGGGEDTAPPTDDTGEAGDGGVPYEPTVVVEEVADQDDDLDGWWFEPTTIHQVEITISDEGVTALGSEPYEFVLGHAVIDGEEMPDVGVRLRGRIGSFRTLSGKPKLRVDFNQFVEDQRFHGQESITLNNAVVDCSYLKEPLGYRVFRELGVPAPRTSFAQVSINGADYGLYVVIESIDDQFLARHYDDPSGNLYDGKYIWYDDGSYTLMDFTGAVYGMYELEEGTDVGHTDLAEVVDAVRDSWGTESFDTTVGPLVDLELLHWELAAEQWAGHNDGYALNTNNYWVYFDPEDDGRVDILPWDLDYGFLYASSWGMSWYYPRGVLASGCWYDSSCWNRHSEVVGEALDIIAGLDLPTFLDELDMATWSAAQADPRKECSIDYVRYYRAYLESWLASRPGEMEAQWSP